MATANFYLKNPQDKDETLIYLFFRYNGNKLKYSTGEKVNPKDWNPEDQTVRKSLTGSKEFNDYLDKVETTVKSVFRTAITDTVEPTPDYLREQLSLKLQNRTQKLKSFMAYFNEFIETKEAIANPRTIQKYKTLKLHLLDFERKAKTKITFNKIDLKFYDDLTTWYIKDRQLLNNSIGKYVSTLKTFLHWATDREYNTKTTFIKFKVLHDETDIVYLSEGELMDIYNYDFSGNKRLEHVRDAFCFGCFTGLRYSDIANLQEENIKEDALHLTIKKTKDKMVIPLHDYSTELLKKYNNRLPTISIQKTNQYLKEMGKIIGIDTSVLITRYRGAERIEIKEPKYSLICSHTMRRTFVTLSLEKGMRAEMVMSITGHKNYKTFKKYIKITDGVKLVEMKRIWNKEPELKAV